MKKIYVSTLFCLLQYLSSFGQNNEPWPPPFKGKNSQVSLDIHLPVGVFARTHFTGAGLSYSWSRNRFGLNRATSKPVAFMATAGADYYFGKKIKPVGYDFRYDGYFFLYAFPGILFHPWSNSNIAFAAGPTLGIYGGSADAGFGANLFATYYLTDKISIGPGITYKKRSKAEALWGGGVRVGYRL